MQAVAYIRVSTDEQVKGTSLDSQRKFCIEYAKSKGIPLKPEHIFREEGESAKYENRPELIRMLEACRKSKGKITHCIVWKVDRLARNTNVHSAIRVQLARNGVKLESVTEPIDDDPLGRAMEGILAVFAQLDNDMRTQRTTGGMKARTEEGGWPHDAPYGYSKDRTPSGASSIKPNDDAPLAKKFLEEFSTGAYTVKQAVELSYQIGIRTGNGKKRTWQTVKNMLTSPLYMGYVSSKYTDGKLIPALHKPLISERIYYKNQSILSGNTKNSSKQAEEDWPLRGGFLKHTCGKQMTGSAPRGKSGPSPRYSCMVCRKSEVGVAVSKMRAPLHEEFMTLLNQVRPSENMQKLFKEITLRQWNQEFKEAVAFSEKIDKEMAVLMNKKSKILDLFIEEQLTEEQKNQKIKDTDTAIDELKLRKIEAEEVVEDKESIIDGALMLMSEPASFWNLSGIELKKRVQDAIFPEGLVYDCEEGFRTPVLSESYLLIKEIALAGDQNPNVVAEKALEIVELSGIRFQVIVLVDGSGSMGADYQPKFDGRPSNVEQMLLRTLAFTLTVDKDGSIPVIVYGGRVNQAVDVNLGNYGQIRSLIQPDFGWTSMGAAFEQALQIAAQPNGMTGKHELTLVVNITDGNPTDKDRMNRAVVRSSGMPVMLKNLAIRPVDYLGEIDDLASQYQIQMQTDASGNKILDQYGNEIPVKDGNDRLVIDRNPQAARLLDNVDSQTLDPHSADDEEFAAKLAAEIPDCLEVMARVGTLTDVPDIPRIF